MKRLLISLICIFTFAALSAQNYSELDLIGEWDLVEENGSSFLFKISKLNVNDLSYIDGEYFVSKKYWGELKTGSYTWPIEDLFVSNGNILHFICFREKSTTKPLKIRLIIKSIESGVLTLTSIDGNSILIYKKKETTDIASAKEDDSDNNVYYNLQGQLLENEPDSGVYIQNGKKYVKK